MNSKKHNLPEENLKCIPWQFFIHTQYSACDQVFIPDTNVLMDMIAGDLLEDMFRLDCKFIVSRYHYENELKQHYPYLTEMGLKIQDSFIDEKMQMAMISRNDIAIGKIDINLLALAKSIRRPLITGDKKLKKIAQALNVKVNGTLWLVEKLWEDKYISQFEAEIAFEKMEKRGRWLPYPTVKEKLLLWETSRVLMH